MDGTDSFWKQVEEDRRLVSLWPQWMQDIIITAEAASTGRFIRSRDAKDQNDSGT